MFSGEIDWCCVVIFTVLSNSCWNWWKACCLKLLAYDLVHMLHGRSLTSIFQNDYFICFCWPRFDLCFDFLNWEDILDPFGLSLVHVFPWKCHFLFFAYLDWTFSSQYFDKDHLHICNASQQALEIKKIWISLNSIKKVVSCGVTGWVSFRYRGSIK